MEITEKDGTSVTQIYDAQLTKENDRDNNIEVGHSEVVGHEGDGPVRQTLLPVQVQVRIQRKLWNTVI